MGLRSNYNAVEELFVECFGVLCIITNILEYERDYFK